MENLSDLQGINHLKLLLMGDSGAGKSTFLASMPRPHVADFDGKIRSAAQYLKTFNPEQLKQVTYKDYASVGKFGSKQLAANEFNREIGELVKKSPLPFDTLGLDSLTLFSDASMEYLIQANPGVNRIKTNGVDIPSQQHYQMARIWFKQFLGALLTIPCHVVVTAHIQTTKDEHTGRILRSPMMAGKLSNELPIYFGEVWRAYRDDKGQHWAQTQSDSKYVCRSEIPGLPNPVKLDWPTIASYLK